MWFSRVYRNVPRRQPNRVALVWHEAYAQRGFSSMRPTWSRYSASYEAFAAFGLLDRIQVHRPEPASITDLTTVHPLEFVDWVRRLDAEGTGFFDRADTPVWPGVYRRATLAVAGTALAVSLVASGQATCAFNPAGGLHHAHRERVSGFCIFNDLVVAVRRLQREPGLRRIAVIDLDGHHGDGTEALLAAEPILTISLHQYDGRFFPGTGAAGDHGVGTGQGYHVNLPLPRNTGDRAYLEAFDEVVVPLVRSYHPELILVQFGVDGHFGDHLVALRLTTHAYERLVEGLLDLADELCAGRLVFTGGGGYQPHNVARIWTLLLGHLTGEIHGAAASAYDTLRDREAPREDPAATATARRAVDQVRHLVLSAHGL
ncbi:MAG: acetoin utilization protein AcuC [Chloroflexi bacterium]|nr:acetoin utilization protein AcuC [Chloroflexota bacterium]